MNTYKRFIAVAVLLFLMLTTFVSPSLAAEIQDNKDVSLTILLKNAEELSENVEFKIYFVASCDQYGKLTATDEFRQFNVDVEGSDDSYWVTLANVLEYHVLSNNIAPADSGKTNGEGKLTFPTADKKLEKGLYLVTAPRHVEGDTAYDTTPFLVLLPTADRENNEWIYDLEVSPKFDTSEIPETVTRKVLKIWEDDGKEEKRPEEITVNLYKDNEVYDTVKLNEENRWNYTWENLDGKAEWKITEVPVEGYKATVSREGITFVLTNTVLPEDDETSDGETTDGETTDGETPDKPTGDSNLPQTGLLWWPVILLLTIGLLFVALGLIRRRSSRN